MTVRPATSDDLSAIAEIYAAAARDSKATFDFEGHDVAWWGAQLAECATHPGRFMLVAENDGVVTGYAKTGRFRDKPAYDSTCEVSVYVADGSRGEGVGNALYTELLALLDASGLRLATAGITVPNEASERLHRTHGFTAVGTFNEVGVKFGQAWDVVWYQRPLAGAPSLDD